jgi:hypothetical protein
VGELTCPTALLAVLRFREIFDFHLTSTGVRPKFAYTFTQCRSESPRKSLLDRVTPWTIDKQLKMWNSFSIYVFA